MMGQHIIMIWFPIMMLLLVEKSKWVISAPNYLVGLGSYDITGPAADINMMGYAKTYQTASGIHLRLRARTFIVAEPQGNRVVFVNLDACMASQLVTLKVLKRLKTRYGNLYTKNNVAISATHTHAGPGGYLQYFVYLITSFGFVRQSFDALVDGIEQSIIQAHDNLRPGSIYVNKGELLDAGVNRSPSAYLNNPAEERNIYKYDVDKDMTLLKFVDDEWGPVGSFSWFAVHGTSMGRTNPLISGDNKGAASRFMEDWFDQDCSGSKPSDAFKAKVNPPRVSNIIPFVYENHCELHELNASFQSSSSKPATRFKSLARRVRSTLRQADRPRFVSAFCQTNCGDVSPNVLKAFCIDTGSPCDFNHSTCGGKNGLCFGRGPGTDEFESTRIIGDRQFKKAVELFNIASEQLKGKVDFRHTYVDFSKLEVTISKHGGGTEVVKTCPAAMGFSFAAGTTDGPGSFDFKQGDVKGKAFWRWLSYLLKKPNQEQVDCQHSKPILFNTGEMKLPYDWSPAILPVQILRIGQLVILSVPGGKVTTMAGRRLRDAVKTVLTTEGSNEFDGNVHVVIAGITNAYSQYVTTFEEYQIQRYEGASTLYGPHTLNAYIQEFKKLATYLISGQSVQSGPEPQDLLGKQISLLPPVLLDATPPGVKFGDVKTDVPKSSTFKRGDNVIVVFWSASPRNDLMTESTFALVEILQGKDSWVPAYDDDDFCLRFIWSRPAKLCPISYATIEWRIPETAASGVYRISHFGSSKSLLGSIKPFTGSSNAFVVT